MKLVDIPSSQIEGKNLIGGQWHRSLQSPSIEVRTPYTGQVIGSVPDSDAAQIDAAVEAAQPAAAAWRTVPIKERVQVLFDLRQRVGQRIDEVSNLAAIEAGKTVDEARAGVLKGLEVVEYALSLQNLEQGGILEVSRGVTCELRREPMGVVAGITPFNFPAMVPMWQYPIALALGNAFILKPSEKVPLTSCLMGEIMLESLQHLGLPTALLSVVHGGRDTVEALIDHPGVSAYGFVGSTAVAKQVYARATGHGKRALALGGAKNHLLVMPDADPEITVDGVVSSFTGCAGQRCMAASLLVAVGPVDPLLDAIVQRAAQLRLGPDMGAIIDAAACQRLRDDIGQAEADGVRIRLDGRKAAAPEGYEGGNWLGPTILDHAQPDHACATKELFGPVLTIVRVGSLDEALALQDRTPYGNAISVFTTQGAVARAVADVAPTGMVGINIGVPVPREPFSFAGTKASRFGQGDMTGAGGVELWSYLKKVTTKWGLASDSTWMSK